MEDNFNQNNFEEFLKEQVRNHRMYPNDVVWRDINKKLHGDKKWPALTIAAFILLSATIAISVYFTPKPDIFTINPAHNEPKNSTLLNSEHSISLHNLASSDTLYKDKMVLSEAGKKQLTDIAAAAPAVSDINTTKATTKHKPAISVKKNIAGYNKSTTFKRRANQKSTNSYLALNNGKKSSNNIRNTNTTVSPEKTIASAVIKPIAENLKTANDFNDKNMVDNFLKDHKDDISLHTVSKLKRLKNRLSFQIYIAPSVSYRNLLEDQSVLKENINPGPVGLNYVADVNKVVRHKPNNGLEAGIAVMYYLSDNFRIKSGFQFNVRQYSIEAYRSNTELSSIALVGNNRIDTINTLAIYRNNNGSYPAELVNRYYQFSIPVGIEWEIIGNKRVQLNVAGSIQPTYLLNHNAYLLSTNFKNYSENPDMVRSFNINSNIETFISIKSGAFKWQIGPQLRYQPYSTFIPQYPIKEHLLDYGIKLGLSKTF